MSLARTFEQFVADNADRDVQICLTGGGPMHGKVSAFATGNDDPHHHVYQITCEAQLGQNTRPVRMPFIFSGASLLWYSPGPIQDESPKIHSPSVWNT